VHRSATSPRFPSFARSLDSTPHDDAHHTCCVQVLPLGVDFSTTWKDRYDAAKGELEKNLMLTHPAVKDVLALWQTCVFLPIALLISCCTRRQSVVFVILLRVGLVPSSPICSFFSLRSLMHTQRPRSHTHAPAHAHPSLFLSRHVRLRRVLHAQHRYGERPLVDVEGIREGAPAPISSSAFQARVGECVDEKDDSFHTLWCAAPSPSLYTASDSVPLCSIVFYYVILASLLVVHDDPPPFV
jgi:hypothetical protein